MTAERAGARTQPEAPQDDRAPSDGRGEQGWLRWSHHVLLLVVAVAMVVPHVGGFTRLSLIDEMAHGDYLHRMARGEVVRSGDEIGPEMMAEFERRGASFRGEPSPTMQNTAHVHPPTYYVLTALAGRALVTLTPVDGLLDGGRLAGVLWLWAALVALWEALRLLRVPLAARWGACLLLASAPAALHFFGTVNTDAAAPLAGALVLLALIRWEQDRRGGLVLLGVVGVVVAALKLTNMLAVGMGCLFLLLRAWQRRDAATARQQLSWWASPGALVAAGALGAPAVLASVVWVVLTRLLAVADPTTLAMSESQAVGAFEWPWITRNMTVLVTPFERGYIPGEYRLLEVLPLRPIAHWLALGATVGAWVMATRPWQRALGAAAMTSMVVGAPLFVVLNYLVQGTYFQLPPRYGLSLLPVLVLLIAVASDHRWYPKVLAGVGGAMAMGTLVVLLNPGPV